MQFDYWNFQLTPVCPKPPSPLSESSSDPASVNEAREYLFITIWQILSPGLTVKSLSLRLMRITLVAFRQLDMDAGADQRAPERTEGDGTVGEPGAKVDARRLPGGIFRQRIIAPVYDLYFNVIHLYGALL